MSKKKQTIVKVDIDCKNCQKQIISAVGKLKGVQTLHVDETRKTITITGDVEPVPIYKALKKIKKNPEILTVKQTPTNNSSHNTNYPAGRNNNNTTYISSYGDTNQYYDPYYYQTQSNYPPPPSYRTEYRTVVLPPVDGYYYGESDGPGFCSIM